MAMKGWDEKAIERNLTGKSESERSVTVPAGERPKAMKRQQISLGIMRRDVINAIWLRPEHFQQVHDMGDHLECQEVQTGDWYKVTIQKIDKLTI